jgi:two-component system, OmpR family, phosphate regulon sensor histidine kinase PhoR
MKTYSANRLPFFIALFITILGAPLFILFVSTRFTGFMLIPVVFLFLISCVGVRYAIKRFSKGKKPVSQTVVEELEESVPFSGEDLEEDLVSEKNGQNVKWTKKQIRELERLKDLEKYRKEFVGNVSHELKTPIFNIQGYILTLLEGGIDDPKINTLYMERTVKNIDRMISIVQDLESINKLESGELTLTYEDFDLSELVEEVFELENRQAEENKITLEFEKKPEEPVWVRGDKKRIMEVLTNLVVNGIKYGKKKGKVTVLLTDKEDSLVVAVRDNGIGIAKKDLPRIFERFYRVDKSRSREQGGTGLGLSIAKHIIEAHGQEIHVKSVPGHGTTFTFTVEKVK